MKSIVRLTLSFCCLIISAISENCGLTIDSYAQAIDIITRDRAETRRMSDQLTANQEAYETRINSKLAAIQSNINMIEQRITLQDKNFTDRLTLSGNELIPLKAAKRDPNTDYMFKEAIIYQEIFEALDNNIIAKLGNPTAWDETSYRTTKLHCKRHILRIGSGPLTDGNGLQVNVPAGYDVMWFRTINSRYNVFRINSLDYPGDSQEKYACFGRGSNEISPDGTTSDSCYYELKWCPFPLHKTGRYAVQLDRDTDGWISGVAFSKNLWKMAKNGGLAYYWTINGGTSLYWESENWAGDVLATIQERTIATLMVPVVPSGNDKLLYFVEHNATWDGLSHTSITVNDQPVERLRTTYQNPFSYHINSKINQRYAATRVPKEYIPADAKFLTVKVDMTRNNNGLKIREIGSHDYIEI